VSPPSPAASSSAPFALPSRLVTRHVSARYADCLREDKTAPIDVPLARAQHDAYVATLRALGAHVDVLASDDASPDACFIEDTAVVTGAHALATRPGGPSRRAEVAPVAADLARDLTVHPMEAPATLDGGDVLRIGSRLFVGLSSRTNADGVAALARVAAYDGLTVVTVHVRGGLHLKSACTLASASLLLHDPRVIREADLEAFRSAGVEHLAVEEAAGANVLALAGAVLVSAAAPRTADALRTRGLDVRVVHVSEFHKGDGALTCLSLRVPRPGAWST
jgi:dimethylargininase